MNKLSDYVYFHRNEYMSGLAMDYIANKVKELEEELEAKDKVNLTLVHERLDALARMGVYVDQISDKNKEIAELREILVSIIDLDDSGLMEASRLKIQLNKARNLLDGVK